MFAGFVPNYSGGTAPDLHRLPFDPLWDLYGEYILISAVLIVKGYLLCPAKNKTPLGHAPGPGHGTALGL